MIDSITKDFLKFQARTTPNPLSLSIKNAKGSYITTTNGKKYLDLVAGVSACSLGHSNPKIVSAIREQSKKYMHVICLLYTSPSPRDMRRSRMPSSA